MFLNRYLAAAIIFSSLSVGCSRARVGAFLTDADRPIPGAEHNYRIFENGRAVISDAIKKTAVELGYKITDERIEDMFILTHPLPGKSCEIIATLKLVGENQLYIRFENISTEEAKKRSDDLFDTIERLL